MLIAVLADVHGNHHALRACLNHARAAGAQAYWFLGDYLGEMAFPQKTMALLFAWQKEHRCLFIRGNKEDYWLRAGHDGTVWAPGSSTTGALWYTCSRLTVRDLAFFAGMPAAQVVCVPGLPEVTLCHGSPRSNRESLVPLAPGTYAAMEEAATPLILCGHRHRPGIVEHAGRKAINPGAVGVALEGGGQAEYLLLHGENGLWRESFQRIDYPLTEALQELHDAGLDAHAPCWTRVAAQVLQGGGVSQVEALALASARCREQYGQCTWPHIPEHCWLEACEILHIP